MTAWDATIRPTTSIEYEQTTIIPATTEDVQTTTMVPTTWTQRIFSDFAEEPEIDYSAENEPTRSIDGPESEITRSGSADTPCPSAECWEYNNGTCTLIPGCSEITCGSDKIEVSFNSSLFGLTDADPNAQFYSSSASGVGAFPTWDASSEKWIVTCKFGECGMTNEIVGKL